MAQQALLVLLLLLHQAQQSWTMAHRLLLMVIRLLLSAVPFQLTTRTHP